MCEERTKVRVGDPVRHLSETSVRRATAHQVQMIPITRAVLKFCAERRMTITYGELARSVGSYNPRSIGRLLDVVCIDCIHRNEPPLTALVVRSDSGMASREFIQVPRGVVKSGLPVETGANTLNTDDPEATEWHRCIEEVYAHWAPKES
ncbi:hypothetical protein SEA_CHISANAKITSUNE_75 [Gordonia phage ChisanaKitsune]|uniref:Uncharacterized protein n=1 Tax=Gordonia phage ChisanaKitsune TaxID=2871538 RepID=A0AAE8BX87_9CAUD|nr:hypothetical protein PQD15_gp075 [Gordonia phage ChisanaKitsune]QZE10841.1 hypothetical protein SEA_CHISANAKITSUNE_75 [Gordonia phage ChisanaKitsune]